MRERWGSMLRHAVGLLCEAEDAESGALAVGLVTDFEWLLARLLCAEAVHPVVHEP